MYKYVCLAVAFLAVAQAKPYGGGSSGASYGGGAAYAGSAGAGPAALAVLTKQGVQYYDVPSSAAIQPQSVYVDSQSAPVNMVFRTYSSPINVQHEHIPSKGTFKETSSEDEAHRLVHTVTKPVIQEVREIITPMRVIQQEVQPVQEQVQTLVARSSGFAAAGAGGAGGFGGAAGAGGFGGAAGAGGAGGFGGSGSGFSSGSGRAGGGKSGKGGY